MNIASLGSSWSKLVLFSVVCNYISFHYKNKSFLPDISCRVRLLFTRITFDPSMDK